MLTDNNAALTIPFYARGKALAQKMGLATACSLLEAHRAPPQALRLLQKTAVPGMLTGDFDADLLGASTAFFDRLSTRGYVYFRLLSENAFTRIPIRVPIGVTTANGTGYIVGQGLPVPLSRIELAKQMLEPVTAAALIVVSDALMNNFKPPSQMFLSSILQSTLGNVVDEVFFEIIDAGTDATVFTSSGDGADDILTDLRTALNVVNSIGIARLFWVASVDTAKRLSTFPEILPNASAVGGEVLNLPLLVSSAAEAGSLRLIDASGIAADAGTIEISASAQTDIEMADNPTQSALTGAGSNTVSMFQTNGVALKAIVSFAAEKLRDDCIAKIEGCNYGGVVTE